MSYSNPNIEPKLCVLGKDICLQNLEGVLVAQEKFDGHRAIMYSKNFVNHFYSRRTSDVTGEKEDNTDRLTYLSLLDLGLEDTILDGELVVDGKTDSSKVQHILGSTPERAREMWNEGFHLIYKVFDVIRWQGKDVFDKPLSERIQYLARLKGKVSKCDFIEVVPFYYDGRFSIRTYFDDSLCHMFKRVGGYDELLECCYSLGLEGIVLKDINSSYDFKRNSSWIKFKKVNTADLVIMGSVEPKKEYTGKFTTEELRTRGWEYWDDTEPVSKTWAKGWVAGLVCGAYKDGKLVKVCIVKGFSDEIQEKIKNNTLGTNVVEVAYQDVINPKTKSLRHPRVHCFRYDKKPEDCLWENI